jgi:hypothetical protein
VIPPAADRQISSPYSLSSMGPSLYSSDALCSSQLDFGKGNTSAIVYRSKTNIALSVWVRRRRMSESKRKKDRYSALLSNHAYCCFCGGARKSATIDHVPARIFFRKKIGPEDFEFPACQECNAASRACHQLSHITAAARKIAARKFRAVLS